MRLASRAAVEFPRNPMRYIVRGSCARAGKDHASAAPKLMRNSRCAFKQFESALRKHIENRKFGYNSFHAFYSG